MLATAFQWIERTNPSRLGLVAGLVTSLVPRPGAAEPLTEAEVALRGTDARHRFDVRAGASSERSSVRLQLRASQMVDEQRSVVGVELDGIPRSTVALEDATKAGGWGIDLGRLAEGAHGIELTTHLVPRSNTCLDWEAYAWVVVESSSELDLAAPAMVRHVDLADLPALWRAEPDPVVVIAPDLGAPGLEARVRADHLLRDFGVVAAHPGLDEPALRPRPPRRVELAVLDTMDQRWDESWADLARMLTSVPEAEGIVEAQPRRLRILAHEVEGLAGVVERTRSLQFRAMCGSGPCLAGPPGVPERPAISESDALAVWTLAAGHPQGFTARGYGRHALSFQWSRNPSWSLHRWPRVVVPVRWSGRRPGDLRSSVYLHVVLDGRALASWPMHDVPANETVPLSIEIPKAYWEREAWQFEVVVTAEDEDAEQCESTDREFPWVTIEPDARLEVPRQQPGAGGIASLYTQLFSQAEPVRVRWDDPSPTELATAAAVLYPFATGGPRGPGWVLDPEDPQILMSPWTPEGDPITPIEHDPQTWLVDTSGRLSLPVLSLRRSSYISAVSGQRLDMIVGQSPEGVVPPYGGLRGNRAVQHAEGWMAFDMAEDPPQVTVGRDETPVQAEVAAMLPSSDQQQRRRWFDAIWLLISAAVVAGVIFGLRRHQRRCEQAAASV